MAVKRTKVTRAMRAERRVQAEIRLAEYNKLSLEEKIARLPKDGAKKQRARLIKQLEDSKNK